MSTKDNTQTLPYRIWKDFASNFDELQNIQLVNRKSDIWFSEIWEMSIKMRDWTSLVWNRITWWNWGVADQIFFIDFHKVNHHLKFYNNTMYYLNWWTWQSYWLSFVNNVFHSQSVKLPLMLDWTLPTEYSSWWSSTTSEAIKKSSSDTWWTGAIWKILIITDNPWNNQAYRGSFSTIIDYDTTTDEYVLNWSWITVTLSWISKYQIYDTLWEHLQISNWEEFERYFFWQENWTIVENTFFLWLATKWLRNVKAITDDNFLLKQISYANLYWTFNKNTLFYSWWGLPNPFLYDFTWVLSIPGNITWYVTDLFVFKDRLIIWWNSYIAYLKWPVWNLSLNQVDIVTNSYWIAPKTLVDVWVDWYFISTTKHIYSLKENLAWTALQATDEWVTIQNYLKNYNFNLSWGFDWSKLYFYWEKEAWVPWTMVVLDIQYRFWSTYTWLSPSTIKFNEWKTYLTDNNSDIVRVFDWDVNTDIWESISQKIAIRELTLSKPFNIKSVTDCFLWLDNYAQDLSVSLYAALPRMNTRVLVKNIKILDSEVDGDYDPMWEWIIWEWIIWGSWVDPNIWMPIMKKINFTADSALLWRIVLKNKTWSQFFLNQLDVVVSIDNDNDSYFSPEDSI